MSLSIKKDKPFGILVVTRPAPESTNRLFPEVVTPNAAKAAGRHADSAKKENFIVVRALEIQCAGFPVFK